MASLWVNVKSLSLQVGTLNTGIACACSVVRLLTLMKLAPEAIYYEKEDNQIAAQYMYIFCCSSGSGNALISN